MSWNLEIDGLEFEPIPENWIDHGVDRTGDGPQCLAVSVALLRNSTLKIRYAHPEYDTVGAMFYPALERESGSLPDPTQWARSVNAARLDPVGTLRAVEREHLESLWRDRVADVLESPERFTENRLIADGGEPVEDTRRSIGAAEIAVAEGNYERAEIALRSALRRVRRCKRDTETHESGGPS